MELFLPCLYAFLACLGFCVLFRINGLGAVLCSLGGALAWLVYLLTGPIMGNNDVIQYVWAAVFLSAYAEVMARVRKSPPQAICSSPSSPWCPVPASTI